MEKLLFLLYCIRVVGDIFKSVQYSLVNIVVFHTHLLPEQIMEYLFELVLILYKSQFRSISFLKLILKFSYHVQ